MNMPSDEILNTDAAEQLMERSQELRALADKLERDARRLRGKQKIMEGSDE